VSPEESILVKWGADIDPKYFVPKGNLIAELKVKGKSVDVSMPEDGVVTRKSSLKAGDPVTEGVQLLKYELPKSVVLPRGPALPTPSKNATSPEVTEKVLSPDPGVLEEWKKKVGEKITDGDPIATIHVNGENEDVYYKGEPGFVTREAPFEPGDPIAAGTDLGVASQGVFIGWNFDVGDEVKKGDVVSSMKQGGSVVTLKAPKSGTVLQKSAEKAGDLIGFEKKTPGSVVIGSHLPKLPFPVVPNGSTAPTAMTAPEGAWLKLKTWETETGDKVKADEIIATAEDLKGKSYNLTSKSGGFIVSKQDIVPGDFIGPEDDLVLVGKEKLAAGGSAFPWWVFIVLIVLCCVCLMLILCRPEPQQEPPKQETPPPPPVLVAERKAEYSQPPAPEPKPEPKLEPKPEPKPEPKAEPVAAALPEPVPEVKEEPKAEELNPDVEPPPPREGSDGTHLHFDNKLFHCEYHPLGIKFRAHAPIKVEDFAFNSYAKHIGVQKGMVLTKIKDEDIHESKKFKDVDHKLLEAMRPLPLWPMRIDFKTEDGHKKVTYFKSHPIGIDFTKHAPIKVEHVKKGSLAEQEGVKPHMEVIRMGDVDVTEDHSFKHVNQMLHDGLNHLPLLGHKDSPVYEKEFGVEHVPSPVTSPTGAAGSGGLPPDEEDKAKSCGCCGGGKAKK